MKTSHFTQRGAAIFIIMSVILVALTSIALGNLSLNKMAQKRDSTSTAVLSAAQDALVGYALRHSTPGTLPCPDDNGDGIENRALGGCTTQRGFLPFRTLGLTDFRDGSGTQLWYAVEPNYTQDAATPPKNSSSLSALTLDGMNIAAAIIAPGAALDGQARTPNDYSGGLTGANSARNSAGNFLENTNSDGDLDTYLTVRSDTSNDQLLGISVASFWSTIERRVLAEAARLAKAYRSECGEYPWAATFGSSDSVTSSQSGGFPTGVALPFNWGATCASNTAPTPAAWLISEWNGQLFYEFCTAAEGLCISVSGLTNSTTNGIVLAPGVDLTGSRSSTVINDYFEADNASLGDSSFEFRSTINHSGTFNDVLRILSP